MHGFKILGHEEYIYLQLTNTPKNLCIKQTRTVYPLSTQYFLLAIVTTSRITSVHVWLQDLRAQGIHIYLQLTNTPKRCIKQTRAASVKLMYM